MSGSVVSRSSLEKTMKTLPVNRSARFRAVRLEFFRREVEGRFKGVILAHHADDQAETVFERLLRGSGFRGLGGMSRRVTIGGLVILRPLLGIRREALRAHLQSIGQPWREDSSNVSNKYLRNRVRRILSRDEPLHAAMIELATACRALRAWARAQAPKLEETFELGIVQSLPEVLAEESVRSWLSDRGVPKGEIGPRVIARLLDMINDAASAPRQHFPGKVFVIRRRGSISKAPARGEPRG
jgi:tRNA(Ile)-lysidine synthase